MRPLPKAMLHYSRSDSHYLLYIYAIIEALMETDSPVELMPDTVNEHTHWLKVKNSNRKEWANVYPTFQTKMNKFVSDNIKKPNARKVKVLYKKQDSL